MGGCQNWRAGSPRHKSQEGSDTPSCSVAGDAKRQQNPRGAPFLPPVRKADTHLWARDPPSRFLPRLRITCAKRNSITTSSTPAISQSPSSCGDRHHHHPSSPHPESEVTNMITRRKDQQRGRGAETNQNAILPPAHPSVRTSSVGPRLKLMATPGRRGRRLPNSAFIAHLAS